MKWLEQQFVAELNNNKNLTDYLFRTTGVTFTWQDRFRVCGEHIAIQDGMPANVQRGAKFEPSECVRAAVELTGHWLQLEALVTSDPPCPGLPACLLQQEGCSICPALLLLICITGAHPTFLQANLVRCYSYVYPTTLLFGAGAKVTLLLKLIEHLSS